MTGRRRNRRSRSRSGNPPAETVALHESPPEEAAEPPEALPQLSGTALAVEEPPETETALAADSAERKASCTLAQLRRFIKSRPYVPLHELRRRFGIEGYEDEVTRIPVEDGVIYVGLPDPEARLLGELVRAGDVGYELLHDPISPAVVGVYPMRPVARG